MASRKEVLSVMQYVFAIFGLIAMTIGNNAILGILWWIYGALLEIGEGLRPEGDGK